MQLLSTEPEVRLYSDLSFAYDLQEVSDDENLSR